LDNRQVISLTSTGPSVTFQLSGRNKLTGSIEYSIADYEMSALSGQDRTSVDLLFSHNFSTSYVSSIGGNYLQSSFDDAPILDFDRYEYFWQNEYTKESVNLNLMLGQNVLSRDGFEDQENMLIRLNGSYKVNSQSTLEFDYSDSYEDIFSNMLRNPITPITPTTSPPLIGDRLGNSNLNQNYELVRKGIGYIYTRSEFFGADFRYSESEREYQGLETAQNQSDKVYNVGANWNLFSNLNLNVYGRHTDQQFSDIDREQERNEYGLQARYRISQSLYTQFTIFNVDQSGSLPLDNYDGLNYSISLTLAIGNQ
jgi:hypothetical protein